MSYLAISVAHIAAAIAAIVAGSLVILWRKGTHRHKVAGYGYVASMLVLNASALLIFELTGKFGPFHIMALVSLATLFAGFLPVFLRRPQKGWLQLHLDFMAWSYIGLLMAAASEFAVRLPATPFWPGVLAGSGIIMIAGWLIFSRNRARLVAAHGLLGVQQRRAASHIAATVLRHQAASAAHLSSCRATPRCRR